MDYSRIVTVDFESERIEPRPKYPPRPVGVSLRIEGVGSQYLAWGHPSHNNCTREQGTIALQRVWENDSHTLLFHNAPFDVSVAVEYLGLLMLTWQRMHDTRILLFLHDPHSKNLSLKPASEALLGWPAEEQNELYDWIWNNRKALMQQFPEYAAGGKITKTNLGEWICKAPGDLVARYAEGDTDRTAALFRFLYPRVVAAGMSEAYNRERRLMPILFDNERVGLAVDTPGLRADVPLYQAAFANVEEQMRSYLSAPDLSFDKDKQIAEVFTERGVIREDMWVTTPKSGQLSVAKDNLPPEAFVDTLMASAFGYRNRLVTCLKMFMQPWIEQAEANNGFVHTSWNQVKSSRGGTRTGRPSMSRPNLLNVSKSWDDRSDGYIHPHALGLPLLPEVRKYVLADPGHLFVHRDFSGQELRIFAHFECGDLMEQYQRDPGLNPHKWLKDVILETTGIDLEHTRVKNVTFARLYGGGKDAVYRQARCSSLAEAKEIMAYHDRALPGRKILSEEIQRIVRRSEPIRTWGGRLYYVEPPSRINGRLQSWEYKMLNYLIQGSAADVTKEAICRWYEGGGTSNGTRFLLTVYDEINVSAPRDRARESMSYLREVMDGIELDVPMRSSGKWGERWGALEKVEDE